MRNNLERFVRDNRNSFDSDLPSPDAWKHIEKRLQNKRSAPLLSFKNKGLTIAASVALIISVAAAWLLMKNNNRNTAQVAVAVQQVRGTDQPVKSDEIASIDPEYAKQVAQFAVLIDQKQDELKALQKDNPTLYEQFSRDIERLDSTYNALKHQLPVNPNKEELLQAMIYNLQLQIDLLNQQLNIIQKIKTAKT
ncbi:MAG: hypothetical protein KF862_08450 [Chitinophagaceae bacterium]|nr:hypothetical protein [Chitinophagaceae bacterium]